MTVTLTEGFLLGLSTGTSCVAMCGPVYAPYLMQYNRPFPKSLLAIIEMSAGKFLSYLAVGAAAGLLGRQAVFEEKGLISAVGYCLFSIFLLITAFSTHRSERNCYLHRWIKIVDRPLVLGILTGINICPPFLLALTKTFYQSGPVAGMVFFTAFFAGTTLFLLPISAFGVLGERKFFRSLARCGALGVSVWFLIQAGFLIAEYFQQ